MAIGLIGQNLMALGYLEEAADAFAHALDAGPESMAEHYARQLDTLEALLPEPPACGDRYRMLVQRAAENLSVGAWDAAKRMLLRASRIPRRDERCHALLSVYYKSLEQTGAAIREAVKACRVAPYSCRAYLALAELYGADSQPFKAHQTLLRAAAHALTAVDEHLLCQTAMTLGLYTAPLATLANAGGRVQTLYNTSVLLLMAGRMQEALRALDQCWALDPDDVPTRFLRRTAQALTALPPEQAAEHTGGLRLYPALSDADSEACYRTFMEAFTDGAEVFARRLEADESLYRLTLYQAENPYTDIANQLEQGFPYLSENFKVRLLREILLLPAGGFAEKQLAIDTLTRGEPMPFVLWHGGRLSFIRPQGGGETAGELRIWDLLLRAGAADPEPALMTHALRLLRRMPPRLREKAATEQGEDFLAAVRMHLLMQQNPDTALPKPARSRHVIRVYRMLLRAMPLSSQASLPPKLWLAIKREETP